MGGRKRMIEATDIELFTTLFNYSGKLSKLMMDDVFLLYKKYIDKNAQYYLRNCNCSNSIQSMFIAIRNFFKKFQN